MSNSLVGKKCIIRSDKAGVFFGEVAEENGTTYSLKNYRKLYKWDGATAVEGLAMYGTKKSENCKFTLTVKYGKVFGVDQAIECTEESIKSIEGVVEWTI